jgi:hypothetical protein
MISTQLNSSDSKGLQSQHQDLYPQRAKSLRAEFPNIAVLGEWENRYGAAKSSPDGTNLPAAVFFAEGACQASISSSGDLTDSGRQQTPKCCHKQSPER